jgi:acetyl-CoA carboxylase carboxyl transferase subunit beta
MNWLTNYVRPKIRALVQREDVPDNLWTQCPACEQMIFHRELEQALNVCTHCGHHMRLDAGRRLEILFDGGAFERIELPKVKADPLRFRDRKRYSDRLKESRGATGNDDALIIASGTMGGRAVVIAAFDFRFMGGSMGMAVGKGLIAAARHAVLKGAPLIAIPASGGARMQEGILSLMQMPRTVLAVDEVKEAGLPFIVVFTDPTTGGVTASFAMLGDIALAEPGAVIGFAGVRVIQETIREQLPEGFQRAEYLRDHGMIDRVVHRHQLRDELIRLNDLLLNPRAGENVVPIERRKGRRQTGKESAADAGEKTGNEERPAAE